LLILAYLLGSIPSAVWIGKLIKGIDIREYGSGNAGTTNAIRFLGLKNGIIVFIIDFSKGFAAVFLSRIYTPDIDNENFLLLFRFALAFFAVIGHIFPVFAKFKGGKGIATLTGSTIALMPIPVLLCIMIFTIVFIISYTVSISSMIAAITLPIMCFIFARYTDTSHLIFSAIVAIIVIITHRNNIIRLLNGTEPKLNINIHNKRKQNNKKINE